MHDAKQLFAVIVWVCSQFVFEMFSISCNAGLQNSCAIP